MSTSALFDIPEVLFASYSNDTSGQAWLKAVHQLAADSLDRWNLQLDGPPMHGVASLVMPVTRADDTRAAVKLQPINEENIGEPIGLRAWDGDAVVRLLDHDPHTGTMLLERLDATRPLSALPDDMAATEILATLLARLVTVPAPDDIRRLGDIAAAMLDQVPDAVPAIWDPSERRLVSTCASAVEELIGEPGDRLLHWDLHYDNILAGQREPWLAIDPKPLAGHPGFELLPALGNRWDEIVATGNPGCAVLRRFDLMTEVLGLDRQHAIGWTLGRVLQNALWDVEDGKTALDPAQLEIANALLRRRALA